jgi:hypothetical protein
LDSGPQTFLSHTSPRRERAVLEKQGNPILSANASAELRSRLIAELDQLGSGEAAAIWAHRSLGEKNSLTELDAQIVEEAFEVRLPSFGSSSTQGHTSTELPSTEVSSAAPRHAASSLERDVPSPRLARKQTTKKSRKVLAQPAGVDKSTLSLQEPRRIRDRDHVKFVARQPCLVCGRRPSDAHHLRFTQSRALARKVSDEFTVPLCRGHHREIHRFGDELAWWERNSIDPTAAARALWLETHPLRRSDADPAVATHLPVADFVAKASDVS